MTRQSFQEGHVSTPIKDQHGRTKFIVRYRVRDGNQWKQKSETIYVDSRKAARVHLTKRLQEVSSQCFVPTGTTLRSFVEEFWKKHLERKQVKPSTMSAYDSSLKVHILPKLGDLLLAGITPIHIEQLLQEVAKQGKSAKTMRNLLALLSSIFSFAVDNDLMQKSPVREKHKPVVPRNEKPTWTPQQVNAILAGVPGEYRVLFTVFAFTGARLGEVLALQRKHINCSARKLKIEQSLWKGKVQPPKTPDSVREVAMSDTLAHALDAHQCAMFRSDANAFLFSRADGRPLNPDVLRKDILYPVLDRLAIPRGCRDSGLHRFRHTVGSLVNSETGNLKLAQKLLGHANIQTTADTYTHPSEEEQRRAAEAVEKAINGHLLQNCSKTWNNSTTDTVN